MDRAYLGFKIVEKTIRDGVEGKLTTNVYFPPGSGRVEEKEFTPDVKTEPLIEKHDL